MWMGLLAAPVTAADDTFGFLADPKLAELAVELSAARAAAVALLFDDVRYPVPARASKGWRVGIDRQPGHEEMERKVTAAIILHNRALAAVAAPLKIKLRIVGRGEATSKPLRRIKPFQEYGIRVLDLGIEPLFHAYKRRKKVEGVLPKAVAALARKKWLDAKAAAASLTGAEAMAWDVLRAAAVLQWNERNRAGHNTAERDGMHVVNAYRVALGLPPLILDKKLHFMARDFAIEMSRHKFFSHFHPYDPSRRTLGHRARRARYRGKTGENASSMGDGANATWRWRADAGHHRLLLMDFRAAGFGCAGRSVLNVGTHTTVPILALYGPGKPR